MSKPLETVICLHCGYHLRDICTPGNSQGHCPECGTAFDLLEIRRTMASLPANMTLSDHLFMTPIAAGIAMAVINMVFAVVLLDHSDISNYIYMFIFLGELVVLLAFALWYGWSTARIDMFNNWRRHALGEVEVLHGFRVHRWAFFSFTGLVVALLFFIGSSCCLSPLIPQNW